ncbi:unknown protein [Bathycoccus prasinos]|uniref:Uncharacterized protein n=1 Tax=Bathycoccus prasinos TaxID=41875 RepID=K8EAB4_9CHLO|nr:unknown protein [Bathycoccus prasinos]CCO14634.1 unknown protein [Bathycoccus prasinos]|eukprot:XP_007515755.1 unknown protein [Bathycoccus prasinos]
MPRLFKGLHIMLHSMPQHLTILTTGSVFQRKLQTSQPICRDFQNGRCFRSRCVSKFRWPAQNFLFFDTNAGGAGNAPDDKKKGRVKKLTTFEQKILLLCLHLL